MANKKYRITEEKKFELIEELKKLQEETLKDIANRLAEARQEDLSEDDTTLGEILEEKEAVERKIDEISDILENCQILEEKEFCEPYRITLGSTVKLKQNDKVFDVKIVSSLEADPEKSYISDNSPLGKALMKAKSGDSVEVKIRGKKTEYKILDVC
ncbi:MAG: GreA/GreB family elongation factor [Candidatus Dojkabacteria bacterium]